MPALFEKGLSSQLCACARACVRACVRAQEYCVCFWHLVSSDSRARRSMLSLPLPLKQTKKKKVPALIAAAARLTEASCQALLLIRLILFHAEVVLPPPNTDAVKGNSTLSHFFSEAVLLGKLHLKKNLHFHLEL